MPGYQAGQAKLLRENQQQYLFQQELIPAGRASIAFQLERISRSSYPWGISVQVLFTDTNGNPADPGTCELDIQVADIDKDGMYCTIATLSQTALNPSFAAVFSTTTNYMKFVRVFLKTISNAVYVSTLVTR